MGDEISPDVDGNLVPAKSFDPSGQTGVQAPLPCHITPAQPSVPSQMDAQIDPTGQLLDHTGGGGVDVGGGSGGGGGSIGGHDGDCDCCDIFDCC